MIRLQNLTKRFESAGGSLLAVDDLSLHVEAGEVYGLLGPNGAGKTTTLRMILGLLPPDEGKALVDGFSAATDPLSARSRTGMVAANDGIYQWLTVREMLAFFADLYGVKQDVAANNIDELAGRFSFTSFLDQRCATLSTGQRQRAILARGLVHDPPVMLLDEPTRGMDVIGCQVVVDYISMLRERGKAVIISTHRLDEAQRLCDRFGLLYKGRLQHEGTMDELRSETGLDSLVEIFAKLTHGDEPAEAGTAS